FRVGQVDACEQPAFDQQVIGNNRLCEEVRRSDEVFQLLVAVGQKGQLQRKRVAFRLGVEPRQEGVVCKLLQYQSRAELTRQQCGQRGLSGADISFNGDVAVHIRWARRNVAYWSVFALLKICTGSGSRHSCRSAAIVLPSTGCISWGAISAIGA